MAAVEKDEEVGQGSKRRCPDGISARNRTVRGRSVWAVADLNTPGVAVQNNEASGQSPSVEVKDQVHEGNTSMPDGGKEEGGRPVHFFAHPPCPGRAVSMIKPVPSSGAKRKLFSTETNTVRGTGYYGNPKLLLALVEDASVKCYKTLMWQGHEYQLRATLRHHSHTLEGYTSGHYSANCVQRGGQCYVYDDQRSGIGLLQSRDLQLDRKAIGVLYAHQEWIQADSMCWDRVIAGHDAVLAAADHETRGRAEAAARIGRASMRDVAGKLGRGLEIVDTDGFGCSIPRGPSSLVKKWFGDSEFHVGKYHFGWVTRVEWVQEIPGLRFLVEYAEEDGFPPDSETVDGEKNLEELLAAPGEEPKGSPMPRDSLLT
jgi:hypothetical protein